MTTVRSWCLGLAFGHPLWIIGAALGTAMIGGVFATCQGSQVIGKLLDVPILLTQLPAHAASPKRGPIPAEMLPAEMLPADYAQRARIVAVLPGGTVHLLTGGFHSACDANVSFDGTRFLFAGKRTAHDAWNIYEMSLDGSRTRQITRDCGNCRTPGYQSSLYTIASDKPWYQITFVSDSAGTSNECGPTPATHLYSCKLDGSVVRRLTFNISSDMDPLMMSDGRLLFASWQRSTLTAGYRGRIGLFGVNIDGTDYARFADPHGKRIKHMPCVTAGGLVLFVQTDRVPWDGAGQLASVRVRRPLHSYRSITQASDGLFHSPSPLPNGWVLVSRRPADGSATHGVYRLDPRSGQTEPVFDDDHYHDLQAKAVYASPLPDGRSSVVNPQDPHGKLYCLNVFTNDFDHPEWIPPGSAVRLRVLEGIPRSVSDHQVYLPQSMPPSVRKPGSTNDAIGPLVPRRVLGVVPIAEDGSFNIEVQANTPLQLQLLDADGLMLRSCGWIWAGNHEPRGCVGCHEDGELTPENWFTDSIRQPAVRPALQSRQPRSIDFRRDVMPIIAAKCVGCHQSGGAAPRLDAEAAADGPRRRKLPFSRAYRNLLAATSPQGPSNPWDESPWGKYVDAGRARTSPLIWHVLGRNTSRPWDGARAHLPFAPIPPGRHPQLTEAEKQTLVEWIDTGAVWAASSPPDGVYKERNERSSTSDQAVSSEQWEVGSEQWAVVSEQW